MEALASIVGRGHLLANAGEVRSYTYDAGIDKAQPLAVVLPGSAEEVAAVVRLCRQHETSFVARGAGTGLSGGAIARRSVVISTARLNHIVEVDVPNRLAVVEPGVINADVSAAVAAHGLRYVPDPSSMAACTIGGNIAENSGGLHCLAYGVTSGHVLGVQMVTPDGDLVWLGGKNADAAGYDLLGAFIGSEGTLGIVTRAVVRLTPLPERVITLLAAFDSIDGATTSVSGIIARGIMPGALEMMDRLSTAVIESYVHAGLPQDAAAVLIVDIEGLNDGLDDTLEAVSGVCRECGATELRIAKDAAERERLWKGRKNAFGAMGRVAKDYYVQDGVIPRSALPPMLRDVEAISARYDLRIANVFHAGDGNLHPLILFDAEAPGELERAIAAGGDILRACVERGGSISGEHGIGLEKRDCMSLQFSPDDLALMSRFKHAFDPLRLCNPGKVFPTGRKCGEAVRTTASGELAPEIAEKAGAPF